MEEKKARSRLEILEHELWETHYVMIPELFVERDIMFLSQDSFTTLDGWDKAVKEYNSQIKAMQNRREIIKHLIEQEKQKNKATTPFKVFYACIAIERPESE